MRRRGAGSGDGSIGDRFVTDPSYIRGSSTQGPSVSDEEPLRIVLTPEQRELVRRMSGQQIDAIELAPEDTKKGGGPLRFLWRLSAASGIPRLNWGKNGEEEPPK